MYPPVLDGYPRSLQWIYPLFSSRTHILVSPTRITYLNSRDRGASPPPGDPDAFNAGSRGMSQPTVIGGVNPASPP